MLPDLVVRNQRSLGYKDFFESKLAVIFLRGQKAPGPTNMFRGSTALTSAEVNTGRDGWAKSLAVTVRVRPAL